MDNLAGSTRRSAILDSAVAEFSGHGYQGGRIERIAAAAGANKQLIFHYFGSKDGLYAAAVSALLQSAADAPPPSSATPLEALKDRITALARQLQARPGIPLAVAECSLGSDVPEPASRFVREWLERQVGAFRAIIDDGQRMGFFRDDIDAQSVADTTLASLIGWAVTAHGAAPTTLAKSVADHCAWR